MKLEEAIQQHEFKNEMQKAMLNVMFTAYQVKSRISAALKVYSLTPEQFNVLRILKGKHPNPMCVRDISGRMIERSSNVPRIIDRLELKKLVERSVSQADKRETAVMLTPKGLHLLVTINPILETKNEEMCRLEEKELVLLNQLLEKYLQ